MITALTQNVVDSLNAGVFTQAFTAERVYLPVYDTKDENGLKVSVYPSELDQSVLNRATVQNEMAVIVLVQKKVTAATEVDDLVALLEEINTHLRQNSIDGGNWMNAEVITIYSPEHYQQFNVYSGAVKVTYLNAETR